MTRCRLETPMTMEMKIKDEEDEERDDEPPVVREPEPDE